jgi:flagellar basal body-associated protein FliL
MDPMSSHQPETGRTWALAARKIWEALLGEDGERRRMALVFFVSLVGVLVVGGVSTTRYLRFRKIAQERAARLKKNEPCVEMSCAFSAMEELAKKNAELAEIKAATVNLGEFEIGLVGLGDGRPGRSGMKLQLEIAIEFDSANAGRWASANLAPTRSEVLGSVGALQGLTRDDLMTPRGKEMVRDRIREQLNHWLPSGKVKGVHFRKFLIQ